MTDDIKALTVEDMAREANLVAWTADGAICSATEALTRFASLVRRQALEDAARVADNEAEGFGGVANGPIATDFGKMVHQAMAAGAMNCAAAIRALPDYPSGG